MIALRRLALPLVLVCAVVVAPACGGDGKADPEELCRAYQDCFDQQSSGPSDFYDQCVDAFEQQLEAVDGTACEDALEDMVDCLVDNFDCNDFGTQACQDETDDFTSCDGSNNGPF